MSRFHSSKEDTEIINCFSDFQLPLNNQILESASNELTQFKLYLNHLIQMNQSALTNKISFAENMAFRVLGSIDWTKSNFDEIRQLIDPILNSQYLSLNHMVSKENGRILNLKQHEVHEAIHEWSYWRLKLNQILINNPSLFQLIDIQNEKKSKKSFFKKNSQKNEKILEELNLSNLDQRIKEVLMLYMIAKWSNDDSTLKFSTFFHYGIPRARIRTTQKTDLDMSSSHVKDLSLLSASSTSSWQTPSVSSVYSDKHFSFTPLSPPSSSSSKIDDDSLESNSYNKPVINRKLSTRYYSRPEIQIKQSKMKKSQSLMINESKLKLPKSNSNSESLYKLSSVNENLSKPKLMKPKPIIQVKETFAAKNDDNLNERIIARSDLKVVKGGIVTNQNVYFPSATKKK